MDHAESAEKRLFPKDLGWGDPWGGGFRHCMAACLLSRKLGPFGRALAGLYDMCFEDPDYPNSRNDMQAERVGESIAKDKDVSCEEGCLFVYPNHPPPELPRDPYECWLDPDPDPYGIWRL